MAEIGDQGRIVQSPYLGQLRYRLSDGMEQVGEPVYGPGNRMRTIIVRTLQQFGYDGWADVPDEEPDYSKDFPEYPDITEES